MSYKVKKDPTATSSTPKANVAAGKKRHRPRLSADLMEHASANEAYLRQMKEDLKSMKATLEKDHMLVEALEPAFENIESVLESVEVLDDYKEKIESLHEVVPTIAAISFSNLETKHLINLGVRQSERSVPEDTAIKNVKQFFNSDSKYRTIDTFWQENGRHLTDSMKAIVNTTCLISEAGRRILINRVIQEVVAFFISLQMQAYVYPELRLAEAKENPVIIEYMDTEQVPPKCYATFITGTVDYLALANPDSLPEAKSDQNPENIVNANFLDLNIQENNLQTLMLKTHRPLANAPSSTMNPIRVLHIEAKRRPVASIQLANKAKKQKTENVLKNHIPQVIGETLATMSVTENDYGVWCLTTGHEWLFGWVAEIEDGPSKRKTSIPKENHTLEPVKVDFGSTKVEEELKNIFFTMAYCFVTTKEELLKMQ